MDYKEALDYALGAIDAGMFIDDESKEMADAKEFITVAAAAIKFRIKAMEEENDNTGETADNA